MPNVINFTRFLILVMLVFSGCSQPRGEKQSLEYSDEKNEREKESMVKKEEQIFQYENTIDSSFLKFVQLIPKIDLPLAFECSKGFAVPELNLDHPAIKANAPDGGAIIGKLFETPEKVGIVYGYPADIFFPVLEVYDLEGKKLKNTKFFKLGECVGDEGFDATTKGLITKELVLKTTVQMVSWGNENDGEKDTTIMQNELNLLK